MTESFLNQSLFAELVFVTMISIKDVLRKLNGTFKTESALSN